MSFNLSKKIKYSTWLYKNCSWYCFGIKRQIKHDQRYENPPEDKGSFYSSNWQEMINICNDREQEIVKLKDIYGYSFIEIAKMLKICRQTVSVCYRSGIAKMRKEFA